MQNFGKKIRKFLSASVAAGLILSFSGTSHAISFVTPEETREGIVIITPATEPPDTETSDNTLPPAIVVITADTTTDTEDEPVDPFGDPVIVDPFNPDTSTAESDTSDTAETTPNTGGSTETEPGTQESDISTPDSSDTEPTSVESPVPSISLTYYTFNLEIGQEASLYWWLENDDSDDKTARYYSSNTAVATVSDSGIITARGAGSAGITVTVGELTASATVNVAAPAAKAQGISVAEKSYGLKIGESVYIQASVLPAEAAGRYSITFSSDKPEVAEVDENGIITARSAGEAYITVACSGTAFSETVYVAVTNEEMIYEKAKLDGCLYDSSGNPAEGVRLTADNISAITDKNGYFVFEALDRKDIVIRLSENEQAVCVFGLNADSTVCLLYGENSLACFNNYEEMAARFTVSTVTFETSSKSVCVGDTYIPYYQYEPRDASVTQVKYISSDENVASVDKNGVITAKAIGEAIITLVLNGGQAQTFFTLTVSPKETGKYTAVIAAAETSVIVMGAAAAAVIYKRYRKKDEDPTEDEDDQMEDNDLI